MYEYEVELQFTSALLGQPDRTQDYTSESDGELALRHEDGAEFSGPGDHPRREVKQNKYKE